jgi:hypothetical protein
MGIGEAMITLLDEKGTPTPVVWTRLAPPTSKIGDAGRSDVKSAAQSSDRWSHYSTEENRESAEEKLKERLERATEESKSSSSSKGGRTTKKDEDGVVEKVLKSREGRSMINTVLRGIFSILGRR